MTDEPGGDVLRPLGGPVGGFLATLRRDIVAFLDAPRHAVIATHDADGEIWQAVVWYAIVEDGILMNSLFGRRWSDNLAQDSRMSMTVFDGEDSVILRGHAVVIDEPDGAMAEARALARRYGGDPDSHVGQHRLRIVFRPERAGMHGRLAGQAPGAWPERAPDDQSQVSTSYDANPWST